MARKRLAWYKRDPIAALQGLMRIRSTDARLTYLVLVDLIYQRGGPLENDGAYIRGHSGLSAHAHARAMKHLTEVGRIAVRDDFIHDDHCDFVLDSWKGHFEAGKASGEARRNEVETELKDDRSEVETKSKHDRNEVETDPKQDRSGAEVVGALNENNGLRANGSTDKSNSLARAREEEEIEGEEEGSVSVPDTARSDFFERDDDGWPIDNPDPPKSPVVADLRTETWNRGKAMLVAEGAAKDTNAAGAIIGKWLREYRDGDVLDAISECERSGKLNVKAYITKFLAKRPKRDGTGGGADGKGTLDAANRVAARFGLIDDEANDSSIGDDSGNIGKIGHFQEATDGADHDAWPDPQSGDDRR